ncbi:MAG: hypothetical protein EA367_01385 [Leptolyngbya sp. DLM2.Bin15]|nr:MAG: hypothetical protein EA367_01385 [Leptolyngbya sp. DLM2.Bin15]
MPLPNIEVHTRLAPSVFQIYEIVTKVYSTLILPKSAARIDWAAGDNCQFDINHQIDIRSSLPMQGYLVIAILVNVAEQHHDLEP